MAVCILCLFIARLCVDLQTVVLLIPCDIYLLFSGLGFDFKRLDIPFTYLFERETKRFKRVGYKTLVDMPYHILNNGLNYSFFFFIAKGRVKPQTQWQF